MLTQTLYRTAACSLCMYLTVMFLNYLFIRANIMAGASIIVYIEAKINNNNNVGCAGK